VGKQADGGGSVILLARRILVTGSCGVGGGATPNPGCSFVPAVFPLGALLWGIPQHSYSIQHSLAADAAPLLTLDNSTPEIFQDRNPE